MAEHERELRVCEVAVGDVEIGPADAAGADGDQNLSRAGLRARKLALGERRSRGLQHHRAHYWS
jgi:hypothetical protein